MNEKHVIYKKCGIIKKKKKHMKTTCRRKKKLGTLKLKLLVRIIAILISAFEVTLTFDTKVRLQGHQ